MKKILFLLFLIIPALTYSQININKTKAEIKKEILNFKKENPTLNVSIKETDSSLVVTKTKEKNKQSEQILQFDKSGKCMMDKTSYDCASCYKKDMDAILQIKKFEWQKLNENQYVSKYEEKLMVELSAEVQTNSLTIIRMDWTKILYDLMRNN